MKRHQSHDNFDDKKRSFAGRGGAPARGGYPQRSPFEGNAADRRGHDSGYAPRREFGGRPDRHGGGNFDRQSGRSFGPRNTFRREDGAQGGYGTPRRNDDQQRSNVSAASARPMAAPAARPVPVARLKEGVAQANRALAEVIEQFGSTLSGDYDISALEVAVSFSEDGRFLGFGQGGAATMTLSVTPLSAEEILEGEEGEMMEMEEDAFSDAELDDMSDDLEVDEDALALAQVPAAKKARRGARKEPGAEQANTNLEN